MRGSELHAPEWKPLVLRLVLFVLALAFVVLGLVRARLLDGDLLVPVRGVSRAELENSFGDPRSGGRRHLAIDIMAPRGAPVVASNDGVVLRLAESPRGGISVYQWDALGDRCFFYGHLDRYRIGLEEGDRVRRGEVLGFVGSTGNASDDAPHLHFEIRERTASGRCAAGEALNPYDVFLPS